jgi:hypothetical protein
MSGDGDDRPAWPVALLSRNGPHKFNARGFYIENGVGGGSSPLSSVFSRSSVIYSRVVNAEASLADVLTTNFPWCREWAST